MSRPDVVVVDEPWAGLDKLSQAVLCDVVRGHCEAGGAVVGVDHSGRLGVVLGMRTLRLAQQTTTTGVVIMAVAVAGIAAPGFPGGMTVQVATTADGTQQLTTSVHIEGCDDVLRALLAASWSIREVRRLTS